jgi:FkbM family methyltransferase
MSSVFTDEELQSYRGWDAKDLEIFHEFGGTVVQAEPGFIVDYMGVRTRVTSLWPEARHLSGCGVGVPVPGNFHAETIEWIGLLKSVKTALPRGEYNAMELGAGFGPWIVSGAVAARLKGIKKIHMCGVEGDRHHYGYMVQHLRDNGFDPATHDLRSAAVGAEAGEAEWPDTPDSSDQWGYRPIDASGDYMARTFEKTYKVEVLAFDDLLRSRDRWDLVHIDVQGHELPMCQKAIETLNARAHWLVIGTHSRKIEGDLFELFARSGWELDREKPCKFDFTPVAKTLEAMTTADGTQVWRNPRLD